MKQFNAGVRGGVLLLLQSAFLRTGLIHPLERKVCAIVMEACTTSEQRWFEVAAWDLISLRPVRTETRTGWSLTGVFRAGSLCLALCLSLSFSLCRSLSLDQNEISTETQRNTNR